MAHDVMHFTEKGTEHLRIDSLDGLADCIVQKVEPTFPNSRLHFIFLERGQNDVYRLESGDYKALKHNYKQSDVLNPNVDSLISAIDSALTSQS